MRRTLAAALTAAALASPASAQDEQPKIKVGDAAPEFTLKDQDGKERSLKEMLADKPVAIVFYRSADW